KNADFTQKTIDYLGRNYGTECEKILAMARLDKQLAQCVSEDGEILAEAVFAIREEMARSLGDIVLRRTGIATLGYPGDEILEKVAAVAAHELKWNRKRTRQEIELVKKRLKIPADEASAVA
ncbi:MAG TPA: glycerol-3-phosphate dehydrogenase C-terminal domain-containing protein, partial [Deltaproteobacteria bacterium]|nr:glycerol-3-phosphate dehydrogenase C-terminal domain-containing protein [Deltaproteobacteria bacterium]